MARRPALIRSAARGLVWGVGALVVVFFALVALYAVVDPVSTLMLARTVEGKPYQRFFVRLDDVAPAAVAAVIASEDATFCMNDGVDWEPCTRRSRPQAKGGPRHRRLDPRPCRP